jgi:ACT domain-containing protein
MADADDEVMLDRDEAKLAVERATVEYLKSGEVDEVVRRLHAVRNSKNAIEAVKVIVYRAIDAADPEREMLAGLLSSLRVRGIVSFKSIEAALQILFARVHDMKLDQPRLEEKFAALLTFLVQDDTISEGKKMTTRLSVQGSL